MKRIVFVTSVAGLLLAGFVLFGAGHATTGASATVPTKIPASVRYPTMLDMTSPEFAAAAARTDVALLPIGAIEEHGSHLPLNTDDVEALAQVFYVQKYLRNAGVDTIIGPPLNIGITNEANDRSRDGTYMYPGSLTIGEKTFVSLYTDVLRSLHDNGMKRVFLYSGHLGGRHLQAIMDVAESANKNIDGLSVYAFIESERLEQMKVKASEHILPIENGQNFEMLTGLLGTGKEPAFSTHGDGTETSLMLYAQPDAVRIGYQKVPQSGSPRFFEAVMSGDRAKNPSGTGGFPYDRATAVVGKKIIDYRTPIIANALMRVLQSGPPKKH
jgi:creatinine amidohydrolase